MKKLFYLVAICLLFVQCYNRSTKEAGHVYIDLGLSVKWATCNIGAESPEEYGDYFAWGETITKESYDWNTYKYCVAKDQLIKYCSDSTYGKDDFIDDKTVLDSDDDVAIVNWGGVWRMPTYDEMEELKTKCTWTWTVQNGVNGYLVTSDVEGYTDKSIFLPTAGYMYGDTLFNAGVCGYYWSSSLDIDAPCYACGVNFKLDYVHWGGGGWRGSARSVRPVCE